MRPNGNKLISAIGLLVTLSLLIGCGSGNDLLDQEETRYSAYAQPFDGGEESTNEIDVVQDVCDTETDATTGVVTITYEPFLPFDVNVIVESDLDSGAEFIVESYEVSLRANHGSYLNVATWVTIAAAAMPGLTDTDLNPLSYSTSSPVITPGSTVTLDLPVWSQGDKVAYGFVVLSAIGTSVGNTDFFYDVRVVLHCRNIEDDVFQITTPWTPVHFSNFDNCD